MNKKFYLLKVLAVTLIISCCNGLYFKTLAQQALQVTTKVAGSVISSTILKLTNVKTGELYDTADKIMITPDIRTVSPNSRWEYVNGVTAMGMVRLSAITGDTRYAGYSEDNFSFIFKNLPYFKAAYDRKERTEWSAFYKMNMLDDCGAIAAGLADLNKLHHKKEYDDYLKKVGDYVLSKQIRLADGTLCRNFPHNTTVWADDLFMSVPFLARMGKNTGNRRYFDDAIKQVENFNRYLYDPATGLYFHCWYNKEQANGVAHWLRCNGWVAMAQAELIDQLPADHPKRKELIGYLQRQITGFSRYQDQSGLWHQVIDKPDSYLETSGTAMFIYALAKAVNEGWINPTYFSIAENAWKGLSNKITTDGQVQDACVGTNIADDLDFYYTRPAKLNDPHATGAVLLAGAEMYRNQKLKSK